MFHLFFTTPNDKLPFKFGIDVDVSVCGEPISFVYALLSPLLPIRNAFVDGNDDGNCIGSTNLKSCPVDSEPQLPPNDILRKSPLTSFVVICTKPPAKSPGRFADAPLLMMILSISDVGIISNENALLSGSVDGNIDLFSRAELYLSAKPLTKTNLSFWIVTPLTLLSASPTVLSGVFFMDSIDKPSATM